MTLFSSLLVSFFPFFFFPCHGSLVQPLAFTLCWSSRAFPQKFGSRFYTHRHEQSDFCTLSLLGIGRQQ